MAERSPRIKIMFQLRKVADECDRMIDHLVKAEEVGARDHPFFMEHKGEVVEAITFLKELVMRFRARM